MTPQKNIPEPEQKLIHLPGGVEMAFRHIPEGEFRMGSRGEYADEEPIHLVRIEQDFWMAETPVTQAQFRQWTQAEKIEHENGFKDHPELHASHPAESMDWRQAVAFCAWLTQTQAPLFPEGFTLAGLPTEAEWEYACRAGTETEYYTGDGEAALLEAGWFSENSGSSTHPVRQKEPNVFQLYDLHGNVEEWCHDAWDESAYRQHIDGEVDPGVQKRLADWTAGLPAMSQSDQSRVLRGGSWISSAGVCRSACRVGIGPVVRLRGVGFRVCLVRGPAAEPGTDRTGAKAEPAPGDGGRGTSPQSDGAGAAGAASPPIPDLAHTTFPPRSGPKNLQ